MITYIQNYSIWLDLKLMLMTPKIMLMKESTEGIKEDEFGSNELALTKDLIKEGEVWKAEK